MDASSTPSPSHPSSLCLPSLCPSLCLPFLFHLEKYQAVKHDTRWGGGVGDGGARRSLPCPANGDGCRLKTLSRTASEMGRERGDPFLLHYLLCCTTPLMRGGG